MKITITLVNGLRVQQVLDLSGGLCAGAGDDGQVSLDTDLRVQLTVLQDVDGGFLNLLRNTWLEVIHKKKKQIELICVVC